MTAQIFVGYTLNWTRLQFNQTRSIQLHGFTCTWEEVQWQRVG